MKRAISEIVHQQNSTDIRARADLKFLLGSLTIPYYLGYQTKRLSYRWGIKQQRQLPCRVISIGNLTLGGTGKTPFVEKLAGILISQGLKLAVLSRGYKRKSAEKLIIVADGKQVLSDPKQAGDEPVMLAEDLPGVPIIVGKDRYYAGKLADERWPVDVILLDDGFQHWALARDIDLVLIDASQNLQKLRLFPSGYLREPFTALSRAHAIILTKCNQSEENIDEKIGFLRPYITDKPIFKTAYAGAYLMDIKTGEKFPPVWLTGKKVVTFCGLALPQSFLVIIHQLSGNIAAKFLFDDHHYYSQQDLEQLISSAKKENADAIITTQKDFVKLRHLQLPPFPILYLKITHQFLNQSEPGFLTFLNQSLSLPKTHK